ncbi:DUF2156 domain-containing protein [Metabacillus litoralis]|uniref:DUF2156 domain-containing protein n=1 Tax=Metabacillus litoralis TaxID=152268 RepID=A0A5C6W6T4_9BACI|nr:phosphatidylglycerol lysyltransferase domain-containing protein [Metabacillus litoralis]TXC92167.1 DUF2156 domain-containing protein [Metabacillus litoralis]
MLNAIIFLFLFVLILFTLITYLYLYKQEDENSFNVSFVLWLLKRFGGNTLSHLTFLQDKQLFITNNKSVLLSYRQKGSRLYVLGDPIGSENKLKDGLDEFLLFAKTEGKTPVFYQVTEKFLSTFTEKGYKLFKIGEEAKVSLEQFTIEGKKSGKFRTTLNKFNREGYHFEVVSPPFSKELLQELRMVSDEWLNGRKEKSFSVSSFSEEYISLFPVSLLRDTNKRLIAFASLPSNYQENATLSIDLMRYTNDSPAGAMDMVFISTFIWAKNSGYSSCSLGLSPLSNVGVEENASLKEKIARYAFLNGCRFYNFKGLRNYKAKFATEWSPRYIAYKRVSFIYVILQIISIVKQEPNSKRLFLSRKFFNQKKAV